MVIWYTSPVIGRIIPNDCNYNLSKAAEVGCLYETSDDKIVYLYLPKAVGILFSSNVDSNQDIGSTGMVFSRLAGTNPVDLTDDPLWKCIYY